MKRKGKLIIISAPSGCGKTTIVKRLLKRNENLKRSISYTTRSPRTGEVNGRDYFFISKKDFSLKEKDGFFLESAKVFDQSYGTSKAMVMDYLSRGQDVVLAIDVQGMKQLRAKTDRKIPTKSIFIMPPSKSDLEARLRNRKTEKKAEIKRRLKVAEVEMAERSLYNFIVVNKKVEDAVSKIEGVIR